MRLNAGCLRHRFNYTFGMILFVQRRAHDFIMEIWLWGLWCSEHWWLVAIQMPKTFGAKAANTGPCGAASEYWPLRAMIHMLKTFEAKDELETTADNVEITQQYSLASMS